MTERDYLVVHQWMKTKFKAQINNMRVHLFEDKFILLGDKDYPLIKVSSNLDDILEELDKECYKDTGFYQDTE